MRRPREEQRAAGATLRQDAANASAQTTFHPTNGGLGLVDYRYRHDIGILAGITSLLRYLDHPHWRLHRLPRLGRALGLSLVARGPSCPDALDRLSEGGEVDADLLKGLG